MRTWKGLQVGEWGWGGGRGGGQAKFHFDLTVANLVAVEFHSVGGSWAFIQGRIAISQTWERGGREGQ